MTRVLRMASRIWHKQLEAWRFHYWDGEGWEKWVGKRIKADVQEGLSAEVLKCWGEKAESKTSKSMSNSYRYSALNLSRSKQWPWRSRQGDWPCCPVSSIRDRGHRVQLVASFSPLGKGGVSSVCPQSVLEMGVWRWGQRPKLEIEMEGWPPTGMIVTLTGLEEIIWQWPVRGGKGARGPHSTRALQHRE